MMSHRGIGHEPQTQKTQVLSRWLSYVQAAQSKWMLRETQEDALWKSTALRGRKRSTALREFAVSVATA
jgi:hypothetical protein